MSETTETSESTETHGGCPVVHTDYRPNRPFGAYYEMLDRERELSPVLYNDATGDPYWMIQHHEHVLEAFQSPDVFSNQVVQAINWRDAIFFLPNQVDNPEHANLRRLLNRWFSPAAIRKAEPMFIARCNELIDEFISDGSCDFVTEFAIRYPTDLLLTILGMPVEDGPQMVRWVEAIFGGAFGGEGGFASVQAIKAYYDRALDERAADPRNPETDFLSYLLAAEVDGEKLDREKLLTICMTMMTAGLDTTRSALGYIMQFLATHDSHRQALIDDPSLVPDAVEEFIRLNNLIMQSGRLVLKDVDFHGAQMKAGDVVSLGIVQACRDPRKFDNPTEFDPKRAELNHHLGWGAGPHRCIGMHLARHEIIIAVQEWHRRIPNYRVTDGAELTDRGVQLSLPTLPLEWPVT
jgi:cytochrome P450